MAETNSNPASEGTRWVSLARACAILGVNESTVRRWELSFRTFLNSIR